MENQIQTYQEIIDIRKYLKQLQQLSWDINNLEKRYPLDTISEIDLPAVLEVYKDFRDRLLNIQIGANDGEPM